jgi:hypothetical protein
MGAEVGARAAHLDLCDRHRRMKVETAGRVGLVVFGLAARNVAVRATVASIPRAQRKRRRAWLRTATS